MQIETIYMYLVGEAVDVWRPVQAEPLAGGLYLILGPMPEDEQWKYPPDSVVSVGATRLDGRSAVVAVEGFGGGHAKARKDLD